MINSGIYKMLSTEIIDYINSNSKLINKYIFNYSSDSIPSLEEFNTNRKNITATELNSDNNSLCIYGKFDIYIELNMRIMDKTII